jgi:hypothetical protein
MRTNPNYVPPLPRRVPCKAEGCGVTLVFLRNPATGKAIPVDATTVDAQARTFDPAKHVSHFKQCSRPNDFSRSRKITPQADAFEQDAAREMGVPPNAGNK